MMSRKSAAAYLVLACSIVAMVGALVVQSRSRVPKNRPRSMRERMLEQRESTALAALSQEQATRGNEDDAAAAQGGERDAFERWFYSQRTYPAGALPTNALGNANDHSKTHNKDLRGAPGGGGPMWKPLGPETIPNGQTDSSAGQVSPVSGRMNAIATHPGNPDIVYAGGAQGGVWKTTNATSASPTWTPLTDQEASLAVGAIAIDPVNPDIIYVGTGEANRSCDSYYGQGILRSSDGGETWTLLGNTGSPFNNPGPFVGKSVSRILIDPATAGSTASTTLWASTTIGVFSGGTIPTCSTPSGPNVGLWRSTDSGQTWQLQNVPAGQAGAFSVQDAAIDPTNSNIVYAAVRSTGVFKSTNAKAASATYASTPTGFPIGSNVSPMRRINVAIGGAAAPNVLYAAIENGNGADQLFGLFKTANGGGNWAHIDAGFNGNGTFSTGTAPGSTTVRGKVTRTSGPAFVTDGSWVGRRILIKRNSDPGFILARTIFQVLDGNNLLLTAATTGLTSGTMGQYSVGNYPTYCDGQCFYDMTVAVDPADASGSRIYVGGNPEYFTPNASPVVSEPICNVFTSGCPKHFNWRSDDAGLTWASISQGNGSSASLHTDDHVYAFGADGSVYDGNDGGIWRSPDRGLSWVTMNTDIVVTQFQGVALPPSGNVVLGGTQDNGTNLRDPSLQAPPKWFHADFGDGGMAVIDQSTPSRMFHTYFNQAFALMGPARSDSGGSGGPGSWPFTGAYFGYGPQYYNGMDPTEDVSFYAPLTQHPAFSPNVIYFGSNRVYRSPDPKPTLAKTPSWTPVSPKLTKGGAGSYLSWIGVLPTLVNGKEVLYTGASDGRVSRSSNVDGSGIATWAAIDKAPLPNRAVSQVLPLAGDATGNTVFATFSGFNGATPTTPGHVFESTNGLGAATWTDISGDLPDVPVNAIAIDEKTNAIFVGTDIGVFRTSDGAHWTKLDNGLPNVAVFGLAIDHGGRVVAATHGRGMFELLKSK